MGFFLFGSFTAPYAASRKQPIAPGCFLEWRLANTNRQRVVMKSTDFFVHVVSTSSTNQGI
jgi:hypothetical protein